MAASIAYYLCRIFDVKIKHAKQITYFTLSWVKKFKPVCVFALYYKTNTCIFE